MKVEKGVAKGHREGLGGGNTSAKRERFRLRLQVNVCGWIDSVKRWTQQQPDMPGNQRPLLPPPPPFYANMGFPTHNGKGTHTEKDPVHVAIHRGGKGVAVRANDVGVKVR